MYVQDEMFKLVPLFSLSSAQGFSNHCFVKNSNETKLFQINDLTRPCIYHKYISFIEFSFPTMIMSCNLREQSSNKLGALPLRIHGKINLVTPQHVVLLHNRENCLLSSYRNASWPSSISNVSPSVIELNCWYMFLTFV